MKKQKLFSIAMHALFCLALIACQGGAGPDNADSWSNRPKETVAISGFNLSRLVPAPVNQQPIRHTLDEQVRYTGTAEWHYSSDGWTFAPDYGSVFVAGYYYQANIKLAAKDNYTFKGAQASGFTHNTGGIREVTLSEDGETVDIAIRFTKVTRAGDTVVTATNLAAYLPAPVKGAAPAAEIACPQFTGRVAWQTQNGNYVTGDFQPSTVYQALVLLNTSSGYTLEGLAADSFIHSSAQEISFDRASVVTIVFRPTSAADADDTVNLYSLLDSVTVPDVRTIPSTAPINTAQYTGTVAWYYDGETAPIGNNNITFGRPFKAVLTLTAKPGFTFQGVPENIFFFSHEKLTGVTNPADSGDVTITFNALDWGPVESSISEITNFKTSTGPAAGCGVRACCYYDNNNNVPNQLLNTTNNTSQHYDWGWASSAGSNLSSWASVFKTPLGNLFTIDECSPGHPTVLLAEDIPEAIRRHAHVITIDMGSVRNNIVQIGFRSRDETRFPALFEVFYSENSGMYDNPNDISNAASLGLFYTTSNVTAGNWEDYNIYLGAHNKRAFNARYIQVRVYETQNTGGPGGRIDLSFREVRVRTTSQPDD